MKRFWKQAAAKSEDGGYAIKLDERSVMTPHRHPLLLPTQALADAITAEWSAVGETVDPRAMPLTGLANAAIDIVAIDSTAFAASLAAYGETDLFVYRAEGPEELVTAQAVAWEPLLDWARTRYDVHFTIVPGIMHRPQPEATLARLVEATRAHHPFILAGLSPVVTIGGSLIAGLALAENAFDADNVWGAVNLDELWQEERWGADALAVQRREARRREFDAAVRFLSLSRDPFRAG